MGKLARLGCEKGENRELQARSGREFVPSNDEDAPYVLPDSLCSLSLILDLGQKELSDLVHQFMVMVGQELVSVGEAVEQRAVVDLALRLGLQEVEDLHDDSLVAHYTVREQFPVLLGKVDLF